MNTVRTKTFRPPKKNCPDFLGGRRVEKLSEKNCPRGRWGSKGRKRIKKNCPRVPRGSKKYIMGDLFSRETGHYQLLKLIEGTIIILLIQY